MTRRITFIAMILLAVVPGVAPAQPAPGKNQTAKRSSEPSAATESTAPAGPNSSSAYVIGPEDVLDISVWKEPEISRSVPVRPDGKISLPLLHDVRAAGLTPAQLGSTITEDLKKFLTDPQVTVIVTAMNSQRVYVLGEVARPGIVSLLPKMTVLQALSVAGGLSQFANEKKIYVLRKEKTKERRLPFNYKEALQGQGSGLDITLQPGDTIVVP